MTWNDIAKKFASEIAEDATVLLAFAGLVLTLLALIGFGAWASLPGPEGKVVVRDNRAVCECPEAP